jgi:hypothetical protein
LGTDVLAGYISDAVKQTPTLAAKKFTDQSNKLNKREAHQFLDNAIDQILQVNNQAEEDHKNHP